MYSETKQGPCYKCSNVITLPIGECIGTCSSCSRENLFTCHIIKKQQNKSSDRLHLKCTECETTWAVIHCSACKGISAIKDFIVGA